MSRFKVPDDWLLSEFPSKITMLNLCKIQISKGHLETGFALSWILKEHWPHLTPLQADYIAAQQIAKNPMRAGSLLLQL